MWNGKHDNGTKDEERRIVVGKETGCEDVYYYDETSG
jgi:hypothetical protein